MGLKSKRIKWILGIVVLLMSAAPLAAQDELPWWGSHYMPGNVSLTAGIGFTQSYWTNQTTLSLYPGAEVKAFKWRPADLFAIDMGVGGKGAFGFTTGDVAEPLRIGVGPYMSFHLGFRGFGDLGVEGLQYLERLDFFTDIGFQVNLVGERGDLITPIDHTGLNYFLSDNFALTLSTTGDWGTTYGYRSYGLGVMMKFGPKESLGAPPKTETGSGGSVTAAFTAQPIYYYFVSHYWMSLVLAGGYYDDQTYEIGDETIHDFTFRDDDGEEQSLVISRALLHRNDDGTAWWRMEIEESDIDLEEKEETDSWPRQFEFLVNEDHHIFKVRFIDPDSGDVMVYEPDDPTYWDRYQDDPEEERFYNAESIEEHSIGSETVRVPAGSFDTEMYEAEDDEYTFTWWLSDDVPGLLVKVDGQYEAEDIETIEGELQEINRGVTSPWSPAW
ncbi:MAG: hypothetical protein R6V67_03260 [Spirochaetia bacterium]